MNKNLYQALAKTRSSKLVPTSTDLVVSVTHRDDRDGTLTISRQRIGPIRCSASGVRSCPKYSHTHLPVSPRPNRMTTRAAGSGDGAHQSMLALLVVHAQVAWLPSPVDHMTVPGARGCRFKLPLLRRTLALALNSPLGFVVVLQHHCTALLHHGGHSPMTAGRPAIHAPPTLLLLHPHALGLLKAIWPVLFVTSASFNFPLDESIAIAGSRLCLAGQLPCLFTTDPPGGPPR
jgi:hypothetical protein